MLIRTHGQQQSATSTPAHGHDIGPRAGADSARTRREGLAVVLANAAQAGRARGRAATKTTGQKLHPLKSRCCARHAASQICGDAASFSEPKLCPLSKVIKVVEGVLRRNEMSGKRALDVSSFRMGEDSAEYIGSVLRKTRPVTLNSSTAP